MIGTRSLPWYVAMLAAACTMAPPAPLTPDGPPATGDPCALLIAAAPHEWAERLPPVHQLGPTAAPRLLQLLAEQPGAPGAPAAVACLGRLGGDGIGAFLTEQIQQRSALGVEAALALGELRDATSAATLTACVDDRFADATLRTAAACALVRLGERKAATPLLHAVLLAGTPAGVDRQQAMGLPTKPRWALERYLVQRLLLQEGAAELTATFDTDAPWSTLEAVTRSIVAWLERP